MVHEFFLKLSTVDANETKGTLPGCPTWNRGMLAPRLAAPPEVHYRMPGASRLGCRPRVNVATKHLEYRVLPDRMLIMVNVCPVRH